MQSTYKLFVILFSLILLSSCVTEDPIKVNPDFELSYMRAGQQTALAGTPIYVFPVGTGEFITLFDGTEGHVYGEIGAKGKDFNKADSVSITYKTAGTYKLTVVSTSAAQFGNEYIREFKTVDVVVVDKRNDITLFNLLGINGQITNTNEILFNIPDVEDLSALKPIFVLNSSDAKAYVNGAEQISSESVVNFTQPVTYSIKSKNGDVKLYTVKVTKILSSTEKMLLKFELAKSDSAAQYFNSNGEIGIIDETNKLINLSLNYGTKATGVRLVLKSSPLSTIMINNLKYNPDLKTYNINSGAKTIKVVAQNKTESIYTVASVYQDPITEFTFAGLIPQPTGEIDVATKTVTVRVLRGTDITKLVAKWKGSVGTVMVGSTKQKNGETVNDFSSPVVFTFYKGTTLGDSYTIKVVQV